MSSFVKSGTRSTYCFFTAVFTFKLQFYTFSIKLNIHVFNILHLELNMSKTELLAFYIFNKNKLKELVNILQFKSSLHSKSFIHKYSLKIRDY